jgi:transcriptional regulator with XRE-family HTH domain
MGNKNSGRRPPQIKPSPDQSSFGIWLTTYLSKYNLSVMDLARSTGTSDRALRDWIEGKNFPKYGPLLEVVEIIAIHEGCFLDTIMMEAIKTHPNYILAKRREAKRHDITTAETIGV